MKRLIFLSLCFVASIGADIIEGSLWQRTLADGAVQQILLLGDRHDQEQVGFKQAHDIVDLCVQRSNPNDCIIIEDMNDADGLTQRMNAYFKLHPHRSNKQYAQKRLHRLKKIYEDQRSKEYKQKQHAPLFLIPLITRDACVTIENIDFRQIMSCDAPRLDIAKYHKGYNIIPTMIEQLYDQIASYDGSPELIAWYDKVLKRYQPFMLLICGIMRERKIVFQDLPHYFAQTLHNNPAAFSLKQFKAASQLHFNQAHERLGRALSFLRPDNDKHTYARLVDIFKDLLDLSSVCLLDAVILQKLYQQQIATKHDNCVCVCVGRAHMQTMDSFLPQFGYKKIDTGFNPHGIDVARFSLSASQSCTDTVEKAQQESGSIIWHYIKQLTASFLTMVKWFSFTQ